MSKGVNESQFYMWRTLFAVAHADDVVSDEEISFMAKALDDVSFSDEQTEILKDDILNAKDVEQMFDGIADEKDRQNFFKLARDLVWADGVFDAQEQSVMIALQKKHMKGINLDSMVNSAGSVTLEFESGGSNTPSYRMDDAETSNGFLRALNIFRKWFRD